MTIRTRTEYMVQLGIFDDFDVLPTVVFGVIYPYDGADLNALMFELCAELLKAARIEYGRKIPKHAAFWSGSTKEQEYDDEHPEQAIEDRIVHEDRNEHDGVHDRLADPDLDPEADAAFGRAFSAGAQAAHRAAASGDRGSDDIELGPEGEGE